MEYKNVNILKGNLVCVLCLREFTYYYYSVVGISSCYLPCFQLECTWRGWGKFDMYY
jgi:hypothetical protein